LCKLAGLFQVTVCDGAFWVVERDQVLLDVVREGLSPDMWDTIVIVVDPSHTRLGCIRGAKEGWFLRHYLRQVCGPVREAGCQGGKGVDVASQDGVYSNAISFGPSVGQLQGAK
jgi:hypothetical protein